VNKCCDICTNGSHFVKRFWHYVKEERVLATFKKPERSKEILMENETDQRG
jgi:hypothetical protein